MSVRQRRRPSAVARHRSSALAGTLVGFSISHDKEDLLARGFGLEHLRELLLRLVRPLLRQGANIAYGGHWKDERIEGDNFTYEFLRHISAEQADNDSNEAESAVSVGRLFNHCAWPYYLPITPAIEARWINCCRIVRVSQQNAGISKDDEVGDEHARDNSDRVAFNSALTLSAMRRCTTRAIPLPPLGLATPETAPAVSARVMLGGKLDGYSGFVPGLFEEALVSMEKKIPLYIVGGFGGVAGALARMLLQKDDERPPELTVDYQREKNPRLARLLELSEKFHVPSDLPTTYESLAELRKWVKAARADLPGTLRMGLSLEDTRELLQTRDMARVVQLVRLGLCSSQGMESLPA
jgi:hypothetical protein